MHYSVDFIQAVSKKALKGNGGKHGCHRITMLPKDMNCRWADNCDNCPRPDCEYQRRRG